MSFTKVLLHTYIFPAPVLSFIVTLAVLLVSPDDTTIFVVDDIFEHATALVPQAYLIIYVPANNPEPPLSLSDIVAELLFEYVVPLLTDTDNVGDRLSTVTLGVNV